MHSAFARAPERKDADGAASPEMKRAFGDFMRGWEDFKKANDDRIKQLEAKGSADVLTKEQGDRINAALDEQKKALDAATKDAKSAKDRAEALEVAMKRPALEDGQKKAATPEQLEHKKAFLRYMRKGGNEDTLLDLEKKALSVGSDPDAGYLVGTDTEKTIDSTLREVSPIRDVATVIQINAPIHKRPINKHGTDSGWTGETGGRPETNASELSLLEFPAMELYAMPAATQSLLDDAVVDVEQWLADEVNLEFAVQEGAAFCTGDGVARPKGFTAYENIDDDNWEWGKIGFYASGKADGFADDDPADYLLDLIYGLKGAYRVNARFVMNRLTQRDIRKFKDGNGDYLWQPGLQKGQPAELLGYPITEAEAMPDVEADAFPIAFGDFKRGYLVADRIGVRVLRDPYTAKPYVLFYTTKRVGGGVKHFEAIKLLKIAA